MRSFSTFQWKSKRSKNRKYRENHGFGVFQELEKLECPQQLSNLPKVSAYPFVLQSTKIDFLLHFI